MSSLIFHTEPSQALIATDTLAVSPDGTPFKFTTKAFNLPHLKMIIAGTGTGGFLDRWFVRINSGLLVHGVDNLDDHTPRDLAAIWSGYKQEFSLPFECTTTVYHFGFSEVTGLIHSFAYRSTGDFQSEPIAHGIAVKPECTVPSDYRIPEDIKKMMDEQRFIQNTRPKDQRVYVGGEIQIHHLSKDGCSVYTLDRFDNYDSDEEAMYKAFRAQ